MLKFLIDHNIPKGVSNWLLKNGYDIQFVKNMDPEMPDKEVFAFAIQNERILLTNDTDFIGLWLQMKKGNSIIFRMKSQSASARIEALERILPQIEKKKDIGILLLD